nr:carbohydrate ABC transporter permease [uncultured Marvinbryantia sp.]
MRENKRVNFLIALALWGLCAGMFAPMLFVLLNSLKTFGEVVMEPLALPKVWNLDNYVEVLNTSNYVRVFGNTIYFSVLSGAIVLVLGSMAGYKLARMNNKAGKATQLIFMMAMMLPFPVIMIPMASVASSMGITNNLTRISVLNAGFSCSLAVIMYSQSIRGIPTELDECAFLDGCSGYRFFFAIIFPLLKPVTGTLAVLYFIRYWNDLMLPLVLISKKEYYTIPLSQLNFYNQFTQNRWNLLLASGVMAIIPVLILYIFAQKTIIEGIAAGAVKS